MVSSVEIMEELCDESTFEKATPMSLLKKAIEYLAYLQLQMTIRIGDKHVEFYLPLLDT